MRFVQNHVRAREAPSTFAKFIPSALSIGRGQSTIANSSRQRFSNSPEGDCTDANQACSATSRISTSASPEKGNSPTDHHEHGNSTALGPVAVDTVDATAARPTVRAMEDPLQLQPAGSVFEDVIKRATNHGRDDKVPRRPKLKENGQFTLRYYAAHAEAKEQRLRRQVDRFLCRADRYGAQFARNWRSVLDLLSAATPSGVEAHKRRMETVRLPDGSRAIFVGPTPQVMLEIMQRTGCHVQVLPGNGKVGFSALSIWGTPQQNAHAVSVLPRFLKRVDEETKELSASELSATVIPDPVSEDVFPQNREKVADEKPDELDEREVEELEDMVDDVTSATSRSAPPIRAVWVKTPPGRTDWSQRGSSQELTTTLQFSAHVNDLTKPAPRLTHRKLYGAQSPKSTISHPTRVSKELVALFTNKNYLPHITSAALDDALGFFTRYSRFEAVRKVIVFLEDQQFEFTPANFDTLLRAAAKEEDVPSFLYDVRHMLRLGLRPNATSWISFHALMCRRFPLDANVVIERMREKGLLANFDVVKALAENHVRLELSARLALGGSLEDFIEEMEPRFGDRKIWLTPRAATKMAHVLLEQGRTHDAVRLVRDVEALAQKEGRRGMTTATLNTFLTSALRAGDMEMAVALLRLFCPPGHMTRSDRADNPESPIGRFADESFAIRPDAITYRLLFSVAWKKQYYNVCRVLWRAACLSGHASWQLQRRIKESLLNYAPFTVTSARPKLWNSWAGKFCVGVRASPRKSQPQQLEGGNTDAMSFITACLAGDNGSTSTPPLSDYQRKMSALAQQAPFRPGLLKSRQRFLTLLSFLNDDMAQVGELELADDLAELMQTAWMRDEEWKAERLPQAAADAENLDDQQGRHLVFEELLARGIEVPTRANDEGVFARLMESVDRTERAPRRG